MRQIEAHKIHHGKGLDCTPVVSRSLEHQVGDNTFRLGSTSILREINLGGVVRGLPPLINFHQPHERTCGSTSSKEKVDERQANTEFRVIQIEANGVSVRKADISTKKNHQC
ncbi:hypothetical protein TNCV_1704571 [Trichonephila clavipes]|nr:hypothetical protein TNCV_1704571 [Trichonephila clavipes]